MPKTYIKKETKKRKPGYRTADFFKGQQFSGKKVAPQVKFNPGSFKVQHKG